MRKQTRLPLTPQPPKVECPSKSCYERVPRFTSAKDLSWELSQQVRREASTDPSGPPWSNGIAATSPATCNEAYKNTQTLDTRCGRASPDPWGGVGRVRLPVLVPGWDPNSCYKHFKIRLAWFLQRVNCGVHSVCCEVNKWQLLNLSNANQ